MFRGHCQKVFSNENNCRKFSSNLKFLAYTNDTNKQATQENLSQGREKFCLDNYYQQHKGIVMSKKNCLLERASLVLMSTILKKNK